MLALITDETDVNADKVPETLFFDAGHLRIIQLQFDHIVIGATMLTTIEHEIKRNERNAPPEKKTLIDKMLSDTANMIICGTGFEEITKSLRAKLDEIHCLMDPTERSKIFTTLGRQINHKEDAVRRLL